MGRQIQFQMLSEDMRMFLDCIQKHDPLVITLKATDSPTVMPVQDPTTETLVMTLWNKTLLGRLERKLVCRPGGKDYYRVDDSLPTLELSPCRIVEWSGKAALLQGRVYGLFDTPSPGYREWYESVARCIRGNFEKNPFKVLGGYVGPQALTWLREGGIFLPMFEPPTTPEWEAFVAGQHGLGSPFTRG